MKKQEKIFFVENLTEQLKSAKTVVLVDYTGMNVSMQQDLKKRLKTVGAQMNIVKNTLFKLSAQQANLSENILSDEVLSGPVALIISEDDPISPISILAKFSKEKEIMNFRVAVVDGSFLDKDELLKLASLPSKEVLFSQVIGAISSPMYSLVGVLQSNMQKLIYILNTKAQQE